MAISTPEGYRALDDRSVAGYLAGVPALRERLGGEPAAWRVREVGDGNLNLVFIVEGPAGGLVVKQALPYVRLVGKAGRSTSSAPISRPRGLDPVETCGWSASRATSFRRAAVPIVMDAARTAHHPAPGHDPRPGLSAIAADIATFSQARCSTPRTWRTGRGEARARRPCFPTTSRCAKSPKTWSSRIRHRVAAAIAGPARSSTTSPPKSSEESHSSVAVSRLKCKFLSKARRFPW